MKKVLRVGITNCPKCKSFSIIPFHKEKVDTNNPHGVYKNVLWYHCSDCGVVFTLEGQI